MSIAHAELIEHLDEQLYFLDTSCSGYDAGRPHEAKRLATTVRVLLHDTRVSKSLLTHLELKDSMEFHDGVPGALLQLASTGAGGLSLPGLASVISDERGTAYAPIFESGFAEGRMLPFDAWWREPRLFGLGGATASRYDIVHWLANKDGGAHVDKLPASYVALTRGGAMGIRFLGDSSPPHASPIPACMRQIAEEVRVSLRMALASPGQ